MKADFKTIDGLYRRKLTVFSDLAKVRKDIFILERIIELWEYGFTTFDEEIDHVWLECFDFIKEYGILIYSSKRDLLRGGESIVFYLAWDVDMAGAIERKGFTKHE